jgi:hypothetical protein
VAVLGNLQFARDSETIKCLTQQRDVGGIVLS